MTHEPNMLCRTKRRIALLKALLCYHLIAFAQMLSPSAAADPASKIDPPSWSYCHSQQEVQSYGSRITAQEPEKQRERRINQVRLKRILGRD